MMESSQINNKDVSTTSSSPRSEYTPATAPRSGRAHQHIPRQPSPAQNEKSTTEIIQNQLEKILQQRQKIISNLEISEAMPSTLNQNVFQSEASKESSQFHLNFDVTLKQKEKMNKSVRHSKSTKDVLHLQGKLRELIVKKKALSQAPTQS